MLQTALRDRTVLLSAAGFLGLHATALLAFPGHTTAITYPFFFAACLIALVASIRRAFATDRSMRLPWLLLSLAISVWALGTALSAWEELLAATPSNSAFYSDLAYFFYAIPILLALSLPTEERETRLFLALDAIQALFTAYLAYITIFSVAPFTTTHIHPVSTAFIVRVYDIEGFGLAFGATIRLLAQRQRGDYGRFLRVVCAYLWVYAAGSSAYNHYAIVVPAHSLTDLFVTTPFLLLVILILRLPPQPPQPKLNRPPQWLDLFVENASPTVYTLALLVLGSLQLRTHFRSGLAALMLAVCVFGIRTVALQMKYMQTQHALREAGCRLEIMSLRDGLTHVANRRCFDQSLQTEWTRSTRTGHPLSLLMIDIDHFKLLNDRFGHRYGDDCLVKVAASLEAVVPRANDLLARYGGEEFAAILPETDVAGALLVAEKMQQAIRHLALETETPLGTHVTVSIGLAMGIMPLAAGPEELIDCADRALYQAKREGRNRIVQC